MHTFLKQNWLRKARRLLGHIYQGTLFSELNARKKVRRQGQLDQRWRSYQANGRILQHRLAGGVKMNLYPDDKLSELIYKGDFEHNEQVFLRRFLRPGDTFVDIGANIGLFTLIAAKIVGKSGKVYAFEPATLAYERLAQNVKLNRFTNVQHIKLALSDRVERRTLITSLDGYAAWNSLAYPMAGELFDREDVQCTSWDVFATQNRLIGKVALMKIDIEGWELYALNGATYSLSRPDAPVLLVEFTDINAQAAGTSCTAVYRRLEEFGYRMYCIDVNRRTLWHDPLRQNYPYLNLLATKSIDFVCARLGFPLIARLAQNSGVIGPANFAERSR